MALPLLDEGEDVTAMFSIPSAEDGDDVTAMFSVPSVNEGKDVNTMFSVPSAEDGEDVTSQFNASVTPPAKQDTSFSSAIMQGIDAPLEAIGITAQVLGAQTIGKAMRGMTEAPVNYESASERFGKPQEGDFTVGGFAPAQIPRAITEQFGQLAGSLISRVAGGIVGGAIVGVGGTAAGAVTGPGAAVTGGIGLGTGAVVGQFAGPFLFGALQIVGPTALERAKRNGRTDPNGEDIAASLVTAAGSGSLDALGAQYLPGGKKLVGSFVNRLAGAFYGESATEAMQSVAEQTGESLGTKEGLKVSLKQAVGEGIIGGISGSGATAISEPFRPADTTLVATAPSTAAAVARTQPVTVTVPEVAPPNLPSGSLGPPDPIVVEAEAVGATQTAAALNQTILPTETQPAAISTPPKAAPAVVAPTVTPANINAAIDSVITTGIDEGAARMEKQGRDPEAFRRTVDPVKKGTVAVRTQAALKYLYLKIRTVTGGEYDGYLVTDADAATAEVSNAAITARPQGGWFYRGPASLMYPTGWGGRKGNVKFSANVTMSAGLISDLDTFVSDLQKQGVDAYYKTPDSAAGWESRHDPVSIYSSDTFTPAQTAALAAILSPHVRSNSASVNELTGNKIADGLFEDANPSKQQLAEAIAKAKSVGGAEFGAAIEAYLGNKASTGQLKAVNDLLNSASQTTAAAPVAATPPTVTPPTVTPPTVTPAPKTEAVTISDITKRFPDGFPSIAELEKIAQDLGIDSEVKVKRGSSEAIAKAKAAGESTADDYIQVQLMERIIQAERAAPAPVTPAPVATAPQSPAPAAQAAAPVARAMTRSEINERIAVLLKAPAKAGGKPRVSFKTQAEEASFRRGFEAANKKPGESPPEQRPGVPAKEQKNYDAFSQGWSQAQTTIRSLNQPTPAPAPVATAPATQAPAAQAAGAIVTPERIAANEAKAALDAIGPEPRKPSSEANYFGSNGKTGAAADVVAKWEADTKAYNLWKQKYSRLKKAEVKASNAAFYSEKVTLIPAPAAQAPAPQPAAPKVAAPAPVAPAAQAPSPVSEAEKTLVETKSKAKPDKIESAFDKAIDALKPSKGTLYADPLFIQTVGRPALRAALQVARAAYRAGKTVAQAVAEGIAHLKTLVKNLDEAKAQEFFAGAGLDDGLPMPGELVEGGREGEYYTRVAERDKGTLSDNAMKVVRNRTTLPDTFKKDLDEAAKILLETNEGDLRSALNRSKEMSASGIKDYFSGLTDRRKAALLFLIAQNAATQRETATDPKQIAALKDIEAEAIADFTDMMSQGGKLLNIAGQLYAAMPMSPDAQVMAAEKLLARMTGGRAAEVEAAQFMEGLSEAMKKELAEAMLGQPWNVVSQLEMVRVIAKLAAEGYAGKLNFEFKVTPPSKGTRQIVLPGLAGMRESLASMLAKGLERNWWQSLAGPRAPVGPLTAGVNSTQNQLAGILRQVMEARKLVNKEQAAKLTDAEKVAMFIGKKQLSEEAVAKLDESVSEEIEKQATEAIEAADDANKPAVKAQWAAIRDAWEEATSSMKNRPASNATMRRMIHAEAKESGVDWDAEMDAANDAALAQRLATALVERVKAETSGEKLPGFPALDLESLRSAALEQAQTVVAANRIKYTERMIAKAQAEFNKALVSAEYAKQAPQREAEAIIRAHSPIIAKLNLPDSVRKAVRDLFTEQFRANPERNQATFERDMTALGVPAEAATRLYQIANTSRGIREAAQKLAQYKRATGKTAQRQAMSDEMKAAEESIRNILMNKGRQTWDQVRDNLINGALNRMPFATTAERDAAADAMIADFKARMDKAKAVLLKQLEKGTPTERKKTKTLGEKLFKLFEIGALDNDVATRLFMEKAGVQEFTPAFRDKLKKMYEDAEAAPEGMPRDRVLGNVAVEIALANPKTFSFWWNLAMSISYGNILGAFTTIFVNNPLGSLATSLEMVVMGSLSNKGARAETFKGAVKTWARSFGDGVAMMRDLWSTGENLQKISQFDSALVNSPVELLAKMAEDPSYPKSFRVAAKAVSQYKWVMRSMMAADAVIRWPAREALRFTQSAAIAKDTRRPGQSLEDAVDELNYPGGRLAALKESRAQAAQELKDGTLKTKQDERLRVIQLLQSKLSPEGTETASESDELANYGSLLNDQPQDFIGVIASAILKTAFPSNTKSDLQKALGGALQPFVRFVRTSANATRVMLDYSVGYGAFRYMTRNWPVIGAESLAGGVNLVEGRAGDKLTQVRIQRAYLGMMLYAGLAAIYAAIDDEEDPYIDFIGSGPTTPDERRRVRESGVRFNSIKIGDNYFPTNSGMLQPLAGILGPFQRMRDNKKYPKAKDEFDERVPETAGVAIAKGIYDAISNQSFTRSLADLLTMANTGKTSFGETPDEFLGKTLAQFVPGNLRGLSQLDEIVRGKKERADGFFDTATNSIAFYAPNGRATTILGDEVDAGKSIAQKAGEKVFQFTTLADDKTLQFVVKNGLSIPDRQRKPSDGKRQTYLEYSAYVRESGKMMRNWLETENPKTGKTGMEMLQAIPDKITVEKGKTVNLRKKEMNKLWVDFREVALTKQ